MLSRPPWAKWKAMRPLYRTNGLRSVCLRAASTAPRYPALRCHSLELQLAYFWLTTLIHVLRASRCVGPQRSAQDPDSLAADEISGDIHVREEALPVVTSNNNKRRRLRLFKNSSYSVVGRKQVGSVVEDWSLEVQN